ncbi:hypothetical protein PANO111632_17270 [Paracoccus nototheniae]|uniref:Uncharacterized protein n=1 Tax=Paracoccus nototheniae TaxID=2489002 RepID=A0ABW4DWA6_9RHOB|nr:hypothetical protein [Paracoccus nototheniae]
MAHDHLTANIGAEHVIDLMPQILNEAAKSIGKPAAFVVRMSPFSPNWPASNVRDQLERTFPGIPVIFVDHGTSIEAIHAAE